MARDPNKVVKEAIDTAIRERGEIGIQVAAYVNGKLVVDVWGGLADETTGRRVDGDTPFPVFSVTKAITLVALHIQAERGLVDYEAPIIRYWPEFGVHGKEKGTVYDALTHRLGVPLVPAGITTELTCDWDWMVQHIAAMRPLFEPGTRNAYHPFTFGWIIGEIVRRTDPKRRPFGRFIQDEICKPLGIDNLWLGIPDEVEPRIARLYSAPPPPPGTVTSEVLHAVALPPRQGAPEEIFGRPDVRRSCNPSGGGIMNARSEARFFAMLANGGVLDGVRLLSEERVRLFSVPRPPSDYDPINGVPHHLGIGGFHLPARLNMGIASMAPAGQNPHTFGHPGAGGSIGWADPDTHLAVAITHNRMFMDTTPDENPLVPIGRAVRKALEIPC